MTVRVAVALFTSFSTASHMNLANSTDACLESPAVAMVYCQQRRWWYCGTATPLQLQWARLGRRPGRVGSVGGQRRVVIGYEFARARRVCDCVRLCAATVRVRSAIRPSLNGHHGPHGLQPAQYAARHGERSTLAQRSVA